MNRESKANSTTKDKGFIEAVKEYELSHSNLGRKRPTEQLCKLVYEAGKQA